MTLFVALLEATLLVCSAQTPEPAPILILHGIDGHTATLSPAALRKPLILHLFSTQAAGWRGELLRVKELSERFAHQPVAFVSVAAAAPKAVETLRAFAVEKKISFPVAIDKEGSIFTDLGDDKIPDIAVIAPDGNIAMRLYGAFDSAQARQIIARLPALIKQRDGLIEAAKKANEGRARRDAEIAKAALKIKSISPDALRARLGAPLNLFYIGPEAAFEEKHIPGAVHLDFSQVDRYFEDKDKGQEWIFYCGCDHDALGGSGRVAAELSLKGFKRTTYLAGHLQAWEKKDYPLERRGKKK